MEEKEKNIVELKLTEYNTIVGDYFNEVTISDFLKEVEKNKKKDIFDIQYDNINKHFIIKIGYSKYSLKLDNKSMENYELGKYSDTTFKLKQLVDFFDKRKSDEETEEESKKNYDDIIERGENGEILLDKKEIKIYIDYLKKQNKKNILSTTINSIVRLLIIGGLVGLNILFLKELGLFGGLYGLLIDLTVSGFAWLFDFGIGFTNIIDCIKSNKLNKKKIDQLEKKLTLKNTKSVNIEIFDKTLENPVKEDLNNFSSYIMKEFNDLLNRINYLNSNNKNELLYKVQLLMDEYITRYKDIVYAKKEKKLTFDKDDLEKLKFDITRKISNLESELVDVREKDIQIDQLLKEKALLDAKIKDSYEQEEKVTMTR